MERGRPVWWLFQQSIELRYNGGLDKMAIDIYLKGDWVWDILKTGNMMRDYIWGLGRTEES